MKKDYEFKDKFFMTEKEWERFHKNLNKAVAAVSMSVGELGNAFRRVAKILRNDKFYKAMCEANKYIEEHKRLKE